LTGRELRRQRLHLGLTQIQLAEKLGMNRASIIRYERDQWPIPAHIELAMRALLADQPTAKKGRG
jgi:transcriptional regulator with XRE-family HTH domain